MLGHHPVHRVRENDIGLARRQPGFDQLLEQAARVDRLAHAAVARRNEIELLARAHRFHEGVGEQHAVMQVERLAVEVAARLADFEEFLDFRVRHVDVAGGRTPTQAALADRQRQAVHHAHERNDPAGLAVQADRLANAADIAPIGADAAALRRQPDILVPGVYDAVEAVRHAVEVARDRQAARGAAIRQHRRSGHEPQVRNVVVQPLRMIGIVGEIIGHAREQVLVLLARKQVTIGQRFLAEFGQQRIAAFVDLHVETAIEHLLAVFLGGSGRGAGDRAGQCLACRVLHQLVAALVRLVHCDCLRLCGRFGGNVVLRVDIQCHRRVVPALEIHRQPRRSKCLTGSPATLRVPLVFESARPVPCLAISSRRGVGIYPHSPHSPALAKGVPDMGSMPSKARSCGSPWQSDH